MKQNNIFTLLMALCLLILVWIALSSCSTYNRGYRKITKGHLISNEASASFCAVTYPPVSRVDSFVEYLTGKTDTLPGTIQYVNCDSIVKVGGGSITYAPSKGTIVTRVPVPCPPSYIRIDTSKISTRITTVNTAAIDSANKSNQELRVKIHDLKQSLSTWRKIGIGGIILAVLLIAYVILRIYLNKAKAVKNVV